MATIESPDVRYPVKNPSANKIDLATEYLDISGLKTIDRFKNAFRLQTDSERGELLEGIKRDGITTPLKI